MTDSVGRLAASLSDRYRIERELGQGGMATVYLAHDVRHDRKVALKVLRPELAAILGGARFLHEIKTTANLQHPHILPLHDSGEADGMVYYVMPYVEGESLRARLDREKQLPVDAAVRIAREVASALDYAHRHGVVHRDIKPENILLHEGQALVADFGIALAVSRSEGGQRMTETGMSLGTPHYMSPEQAMGEREITPKSDIYALGCVLYEMLSGEPPFTGPTAQAIIARVMTEQPRSLTVQRHTVPPALDEAVQTALEKLPADRYASAALFSEALDAGMTAARPGGMAVGALTLREKGRAGIPPFRPTARFGFAAIVLVLLGAGLAWALQSRPTLAQPGVVRFHIRQTSATTLFDGNGQIIAVSPDGSRIVYLGPNAQLLLRAFDQLDAVPMPGATGASNPFFSPDGRWVAFIQQGRMVKVAVSGGPVLPICEVINLLSGASWGSNDTIVFSGTDGLWLVPAAGGQPSKLGSDSVGGTSIWPEWLPGARAILFTERGATDRLAVLDRTSGRIKRFDQPGTNPRYVSGGYVVLGSQGTLIAVPFDARRLEVRGPSVPIAENVYIGSGGASKMGISRSGTIAYAVGTGVVDLVTVDRRGASQRLEGAGTGLAFPRVSPDGRRVALEVGDGGGQDIWVYDIRQHTRTRLTFDHSSQRPTWSADGRRVLFTHRGSSGLDLAWIPADGSAAAESLWAGPDEQWTGDVTRDGGIFVFRNGGAGLKRSLWTMSPGGEAGPLVATRFDSHSPTLSPDGHWLAYVSDESGQSEVYVRPFPGLGGKWQVSLDGGQEPRWSPTGGEIFYRSSNRMMAAAVRTSPTFSVGARTELFNQGFVTFIFHSDYDVMPDGRTFIMLKPENEGHEFVVVLNLFENLPQAGHGG